MIQENQKRAASALNLAAQMAKRKAMPSPFLEDWDLPKSTPASVRRKIEDTAIHADSQCALWAYQLRRIADLLRSHK